jgi:hypothetical protein
MLGTVVLPVLLSAEADHDEQLASSSFKPIWDILNALKSHDSELSDELDRFRTELGRTGHIGGGPSRVRFDLPLDIELTYPDFREHLIVAVVEQTTSTWQWWFGQLESFVKAHGHALVPDEYQQNGIQLGKWITKQRAKHNRGHLPKDKVKRLESLKGWSWDPIEDQWNSAFRELKSFLKAHGHARVPQHYRQNGIQLGTWIGKQRAKHNRGHLPKDKVKRLESLKGWSWDPREDSWNSSYQELKSFLKAHGHARVPDEYQQNGIQLGTWISTQRNKYKRGRLPVDKAKRLESLRGWSWGPHKDQWNSAFQELKSFLKAHGHARVPQHYRQNGIQLGTWITNQRAKHNRGHLPKDRVKRLESLKGWSWGPHKDQWNSAFQELKSFLKAHGHALVPQRYRQNGIQLGTWVNTQRNKYKRGHLPKDKVKQLESLKGWSWDPIEDQWNSSYQELKSFLKAHGHARVPARHRQNGIELGTWVSTQRIKYKRGRLPVDKAKRLESLRGWLWDPREDQWNSAFRELESFVKAHGHALVPKHYRQNGIQLGTWITNQRAKHNSGHLPKDRVIRLESLKGWSWNGPRTSRTKSVPRGRRNQ